MRTASNELDTAWYPSNPPIDITALSYSAEELRLSVVKPGKTPNPRKPDTLTVFALSSGDVGAWNLKSVLIVQLRRSRKRRIASTWLAGITEYGDGDTDENAITDLVNSLGDYREGLKKRKGKLGASAREELRQLERLIGPASSTGSTPASSYLSTPMPSYGSPASS